MRRAAGVCAKPGCIGLPVRRGRCADHAPRSWAGSHERRAKLLPGTRELGRIKQAVRARAGGRCESCGQPAELIVDHCFPLALGGPTTPENLQALCPSCEAAKTRMDMQLIRRARARS